jgi:hypothetical protein
LLGVLVVVLALFVVLRPVTFVAVAFFGAAFNINWAVLAAAGVAADSFSWPDHDPFKLSFSLMVPLMSCFKTEMLFGIVNTSSDTVQPVGLKALMVMVP